MKMRNGVFRTISCVSLVCVILFSLVFQVNASVLPNSLTLNLAPQESSNQIAKVTVPALPPKADIVFCFDLTGSMGGILDTAKTKSNDIMNQLSLSGVDINYGVISHMDYPGSYSSFGYSEQYGASGIDYPYIMNLPITSDRTNVSSVINSLNLGNGSDAPENYTRVLYESYKDSTIAWRSGAKKIFVNFGDNLPHDNNINEGVPDLTGIRSTGGDPGRDGIISTADDLDLQNVLNDMKSNNILLLACQSNGAEINYWKYWAGITGGIAFNTNSVSLSVDVVNCITSMLTNSTINNLRLVAAPGYEGWLNSTKTYSGPTNVTIPFNYTIKVPTGTALGIYSFAINAIDNNGVNFGTINVSVTVSNRLLWRGTGNFKVTRDGTIITPQ